jgi:hypothetical protein
MLRAALVVRAAATPAAAFSMMSHLQYALLLPLLVPRRPKEAPACGRRLGPTGLLQRPSPTTVYAVALTTAQTGTTSSVLGCPGLVPCCRVGSPVHD